jgi:FkbH-like protein
MNWDRAGLPWLPAAPADFSARCKQLTAGPDPGLALRALASYRLNGNQLSTLSRAAGRLPSTLSPLVPMSVAIIGDGSHELIREALVGTAPRHGLRVSMVDVPFGSGEMMALDRGSALHQAQPDVVILNFTYRALLRNVDYADAAGASAIVEDALSRLRGIVDGVAQAWRPIVVVQTIARPADALFGSYDARLPGTPTGIVDAINRGIVELTTGSNVLFDVAALAASVGLDGWHDQTQWHSYKLPFAQRLVPLYADHVTRLVAAVRGLTRKCLVLDLDNTLWGGVIGDDGVEGIRLGQGLADGEAFLEVQRTAKALRQRGIILAVSSKNTDDVARRAFREHPDMLLSEDDIAVFQANWDDKPRNLEAIAMALGIGVDSLVLLDDNPAERELVRQQLPQVGVPELPDDPALFSQVLLASGLFEAVGYSIEDAQRAASYAARAIIAERRAGAADLETFLSSLEMVISFSPFDAVGRSRIAQLINKSNQFNLTTRRYSEAEVAAMEQDLLTLQVRLQDRFADHGMIGVVICRPGDGGEWEIDTWLMSCRVLGRRVEEAVLNEVAAQASAQGARTLRGRYIASGRNAIVSDHYRKLGFELLSESGDASEWRLDLATFQPATLPFAVHRAASLSQ